MLQVHLASILHFLEDPAKSGEEDSYRYYSDGALVVEDGLVKHVGGSEELLSSLQQDADIFDRIIINSDSIIFKEIADRYDVDFYYAFAKA